MEAALRPCGCRIAVTRGGVCEGTPPPRPRGGPQRPRPAAATPAAAGAMNGRAGVRSRGFLRRAGCSARPVGAGGKRAQRVGGLGAHYCRPAEPEAVCDHESSNAVPPERKH